MDHINVKILASPGAAVDWPALIPVFHRWIQKGVFAEILPIDVADYSHVPQGPGILLIGHHAAISLDNRENRLGLLYNRKTAVAGDVAEKVRLSRDGALAAARRLSEEPELRGLLHFDESNWEIFVNDRLLAPNTAETWAKVRPELERLYPSAELNWRAAPRELFRVHVRLSPATVG